MKPYFSVDVETTGLDRTNDQMLEIAAIYEDPSRKLDLENIPKFHCFVAYKTYRGSSPYAISLNKRIFDELVNHENRKPTTAPVYDIYDAVRLLSHFLQDHALHKVPEDEVRFTGKQFASFDLQFLQRDGMNQWIRYNHRFLDIGSFLFDPKTMDWIPSTSECYKIAGIQKEVSHTAVGDAWEAIQIIRSKY